MKQTHTILEENLLLSQGGKKGGGGGGEWEMLLIYKYIYFPGLKWQALRGKRAERGLL